MVEVPANFTPLDPGRINSADPFEIGYWSGRFGCSTATLTKLVGRVGAHAAMVREALETHPPGRQESIR